MDDKELFSRFLKLTTCHASDGMDKLKIRRGGLPGIHGMEPVKKIIGRALTVTLLPAEGNEPRRIEYLASAKPGDVIVLANNGRNDCSVWGGQRTIGAQQRGAIAAVVDGCYRDVNEHRELGFPVYGRESTSMSSSGSVVPVAVNETVTMSGLKVNAGDVVFGDDSGVIVIPGDRAEEVLKRAEATLEEEAGIAKAVQAGGADFVAHRAKIRGGATAA